MAGYKQVSEINTDAFRPALFTVTFCRINSHIHGTDEVTYSAVDAGPFQSWDTFGAKARELLNLGDEWFQRSFNRRWL